MTFKNIKLYALLSLGILSTGFTSCKQETKPAVKQVDIQFKKEGELIIYKAKSDSILKRLDIEIADTDYDIQTGLMYRKSMKDNRGMLFVFPDENERYFYMKNTRIALDLIYVNAKNTIVSFQENTTPFDEGTLASNAPAKYVLEVNSGLVKAWNLAIGDSIAYSKL